MTKRLAFLALASFAASVADVGAGDAISNQRFFASVMAITPQCRDHPDAPVVGRVSGQLSGPPTRGVSFVGCFPDLARCERWRGPVSGQITGRIIQNSCSMR